MKLEIPFEMGHDYDEFLREVPTDFGEMEKGVTFLLDKINEAENKDESAHLHSNVGVYLRILNRLDESEKYLKEAIRLFIENKKNAPKIQAQIRLGSVKQWQEHFIEADKVFRDALKEIESKGEGPVCDALTDYCLYSQAKMKFQQGQNMAALDLFTKCHEMRLIKGDEHLMKLAAHCMHVVKEKIDSKKK